MKSVLLAASAALIATPALAQEGPSMEGAPTASVEVATAVETVPIASAAQILTLPANSEILLRMSEELTTKGGQAKEGQMFRLTVVHDVKVNGQTVIPMGTPATGEVTWKTGRAVFGKSGKMEIALRYVDLDGQRIDLAGEYRQEGEGDTLAAVGAVVLAAPLLVITGKSAVIPRGKEMMAHTVSPVEFSL